MRNVIAVNSNVSLIECLRKLCAKMNIIQRKLDSAYHDSIRLRKNIIRTCRNHSALIFELINSSMNISTLINTLQFSIINYEVVRNFSHNSNINIIRINFIKINIIKRKMKLMINISLTNSIVERNHHSIVEKIFETEMIDFKHVVLKNALYAKNLIVNQSIIQKKTKEFEKAIF